MRCFYCLCFFSAPGFGYGIQECVRRATEMDPQLADSLGKNFTWNGRTATIQGFGYVGSEVAGYISEEKGAVTTIIEKNVAIHNPAGRPLFWAFCFLWALFLLSCTWHSYSFRQESLPLDHAMYSCAGLNVEDVRKYFAKTGNLEGYPNARTMEVNKVCTKKPLSCIRFSHAGGACTHIPLSS